MIPYTIDPREDTGVTNVTLGVWLFLASEVMLFGSLFSAYALLRVSALAWPHGTAMLSTSLAAANTAVLAAGWIALGTRRTDVGGMRQRLLANAAFALVFLAIKVHEYRGDVANGLVPAASTFLATYFTLTGLHALHVAGGVVANLWAVAGASRVGEAMTAGRFRALRLYWTFVDVIWLVIFVVVYLS
jgi:heme/copper-type cytochrome/quinol oxidase subunit 3